MSGRQPTAAQRAQRCPTCADDPKAAPGRYCAPYRCRCGHQACPAVASYQPRRAPLDNVHPITTRRTSTVWDTREESTWIDGL